MQTMIYNPGFLEPKHFNSSFCVRTRELEYIVDSLRECSGNSNIHHIIIGPRGIGKTCLVLKVFNEIRLDIDLSSRFYPVVFTEESYRVSTAGEFWLECILRMTDLTPHCADGPDLSSSYEELLSIRDDQMLGDRCLGIIQDFAARKRKRLVLIVENLNMLFQDMKDTHAGWRLRHVLQNEPCIVLLASATSRFDEIDDYDKALYDLFNVLTLNPLDKEECKTLWYNLTGQTPTTPKIAALRILTGGNPRLLTIIARFGANLSMPGLINDIIGLIDDHTEYFKSHIDALPPTERRVYLALAEYWKPVTASEISIRTRLNTNKCSAYLKRLITRGAVEEVGGGTHRKLYYLSERLFNIYYLMRQARGPNPLVQALIYFMEGFYSNEDLNDVLSSISREIREEDNILNEIYNSLKERLSQTQQDETNTPDSPYGLRSDKLGAIKHSTSTEVSNAKNEYTIAHSLEENGELHAAIDMWQGIVDRFTDNQSQAEYQIAMIAHLRIGLALTKNNLFSEAIMVWNEILHQYMGMHNAWFKDMVATALLSKCYVLEKLNRPEEALSLIEDLLGNYQKYLASDDLSEIAKSIDRLALAYKYLDQLDEAVDAWNILVNHMGNSQGDVVRSYVFKALICKIHTLYEIDRKDIAIETINDAEILFQDNDKQEWILPIKLAKAEILSDMNQLKLALDVINDILTVEDTFTLPDMNLCYAHARNLKGITLANLNRIEEAIEQWGELANRHENNPDLSILENVVAGMFNKSTFEVNLGRMDDALATCDLIIHKFGTREELAYSKYVSDAYSHKINIYLTLDQKDKALEVCEGAERHFANSPHLNQLVQLSIFLLKKADVLHKLDMEEEVVTIWKEIEKYEKLDHPSLRLDVSLARLNLANHELVNGKIERAIEYANLALKEDQENPDIHVLSYLIRAHARYFFGDMDACICDLESGLNLVQSFRKISKAVLIVLTDISKGIGPEILLDVIRSSSAASLLLPFTTALELMMGLKPRVAREVEEVARDILKEMENRQQ